MLSPYHKPHTAVSCQTEWSQNACLLNLLLTLRACESHQMKSIPGWTGPSSHISFSSVPVGFAMVRRCRTIKPNIPIPFSNEIGDIKYYWRVFSRKNCTVYHYVYKYIYLTCGSCPWLASHDAVVILYTQTHLLTDVPVYILC